MRERLQTQAQTLTNVLGAFDGTITDSVLMDVIDECEAMIALCLKAFDE